MRISFTPASWVAIIAGYFKKPGGRGDFMRLETLIFSWMEFLAIQKGQRPRGVATYERVVRGFFRWAAHENYAAVDRGILSEWMRSLFYDQGNLSNRSRASKLSALRSFFGWLVFAGHLRHDPTKDMPSPRIQPALPQKFSTDELRLLFAAPSRETLQGKRDIAILKTLYAAGPRVSELVGLNQSDITDTGGYIRLQIKDGKGGKGRTVTMRTNPSRSLREWLAIRRELPSTSDAVFIRLHKGGKSTETDRLSTRYILDIIKKYAAIVGIDSADAFCHKMRSTFATDLYDSGDDKCPRCGHAVRNIGIYEIMALMGHADPKTTMGYIAISERTLRKTAIPDKRFREIEEDL